MRRQSRSSDVVRNGSSSNDRKASHPSEAHMIVVGRCDSWQNHAEKTKITQAGLGAEVLQVLLDSWTERAEASAGLVAGEPRP